MLWHPGTGIPGILDEGDPAGYGPYRVSDGFLQVAGLELVEATMRKVTSSS